MKKIISYRELETPKKFIETGRIVKDILSRGEKVIIWTTFVRNIHELKEHLGSLGIESELLYGEIPVAELGTEPEGVKTRERIIEDFHNPDSEFKVIIANPFVVGESISLHKACHNAIYLERTFNAVHFLQSKDRIHRVGLEPDDVINYYYLLSEDSIDQTIHDRLIFKEERMLNIIENEPIPLINMNMDYEDDLEDEDLKAVIRDYLRRAKRS